LSYEDISNNECSEFEREFKHKARFLVDENLGKDIASIIFEYGYNTVFVGDIGLTGHFYTDIFSSAWKEKRIILNHRNPGVVVLPGAENGKGLEQALADLIRLLPPYVPPSTLWCKN